MPIEQDFSNKKTFSPTQYIIFRDNTGTPIDLVAGGWNFETKVRQSYKPNAEVMEIFSTANGKMVLSLTETGRVDFVFDGSEFEDVVIKGIKIDYPYDMEANSSAGQMEDVFQGNWVVFANL